MPKSVALFQQQGRLSEPRVPIPAALMRGRECKATLGEGLWPRATPSLMRHPFNERNELLRIGAGVLRDVRPHTAVPHTPPAWEHSFASHSVRSSLHNTPPGAPPGARGMSMGMSATRRAADARSAMRATELNREVGNVLPKPGYSGYTVYTKNNWLTGPPGGGVAGGAWPEARVMTPR